MARIIEILRTFLYGSSPLWLAAQFAALFAVSLLLVYQILKMRRDTVVVLSHRRIWLGAGLASVLNLGFLHGAMWFVTAWWKWLLVLLVYMFWKLLLYAVVRPFTADTSLVDTVKSTDDAFNCNWPLIPRCAHQSLLYFLMGVAVVIASTITPFWKK